MKEFMIYSSSFTCGKLIDEYLEKERQLLLDKQE
jgi:hypothetical protein